ncbi:acyltransferase family protein [Microbulbifer halophilus]|uniref:Acyltransferase family protein n=1 Tax=Microbulbifer halophilus TaxID=453963 RepID=A0ABW5ECQ5_9GAMM|nr:heparan-alpha-glucosaminide N-acetyltransferase domain-containing protein [Microbulbifer halophilus]MCW8126983.1 heparan-alpha-glucosaminide N-acetyltransferase domain-containing protein [Microbulbifer halophilus]
MYSRHAQEILAGVPEGRLVAVDLLRGFAIAAMVLVNNPGSWSYVYAPLAHAEWHGWTPTDVIFPLFLFVVGLSLVLANGGGKEFPAVGWRYWSRALKLFALGLLLAIFFYNFHDASYSWPQDRLENIRWLGILQRIALVYIICCYLLRWCSPRGLLLVALALVAVPWLLMLSVPYASDSGEVFRGELSFGNHFSAWLDQAVLGSAHLYYRNAQPFAFDPEGLLTTLPAVATCLLGVLAGLGWKAAEPSPAGKTRIAMRWLVCGLLLLGLGQLLHPWVPINKALWSPSFVAVTGGVSLILLAACFYFADIRRHHRALAPLLVLGVNAIALFMLAGIVGRLLIMVPVGDLSLKQWLFDGFYRPLFGGYGGSLLFALSCLAVFYAVMWQLYRRRIIWKV